MKKRTSDMLFHTAGGRVALTVLRRAAEIGLVHGDGRLGLGSRQELAISGVAPESRNSVRQGIGGLLPEHHPRRPNIVTTRAATGMAQRSPWLSEGAYDHVLESFTSPPAIAVNLIDPRQYCMPRYTGQLHAVASSEPEFWHVGFNTAPQGPPAWLAPAVHSAGVAAVTRLIQQALVWTRGPDLARLHAQIEQHLAAQIRDIAPGPPGLTGECRPLLGFDRQSANGPYSLGIPASMGPLPCQFLVDLAVLARQFEIATAYLTPWKSLILHGIPRDGRTALETLLLRHRVSLGTGGWDGVCFNHFRSPHAVEAGTNLLRALNQRFPHPGPLRIGLVEDPSIIPDTPVIVRAETQRGGGWPLWSQRPRFSVFIQDEHIRPGAPPRRCALGLRASALNDAVLNAIERYCADGPAPATDAPPGAPPGVAHRCTECRTEYNALYGDPLGKVDAGTPFDELPATWRCPTCEAPLGAYREVREAAA